MKFYIWGTGNYYNYYKRFVYLPYVEIVALIDTNADKQGRKIDDFFVLSPDEALETNENINMIIATKYQAEIKDYLYRYNFHGEIYSIFDFPFNYIDRNRTEILDHFKRREKTQKPYIVFDIIGGLGWAGTEKWAYNASNLLVREGLNSFVLGDTNQPKMEDKLEKNTVRIERTSNYLDVFLQYIGSRLPMVYFSNFWDESQKYAMIARCLFGNDFRLVQVFHSDANFLYDEWEKYSGKFDYTFCVSDRIKEKCVTRIPKFNKKIEFCTAIQKVDNTARDYSRKCIKIGWAGRLVYSQKRADLLQDIVKLLDAEGILYNMNIAGTGECFDEINQFIEKQKLEDHVHCLGFLDSDKMIEFWNSQDVYLSVSSEEGASLSMLEAMACGCVPVVTDVSGVSDVIIDGWNGFVVPVDEWSRIPEKMKYLSEHTELLEIMGNRCKEVIREKCSKEKFVSKLLSIIQG